MEDLKVRRYLEGEIKEVFLKNGFGLLRVILHLPMPAINIPK